MKLRRKSVFSLCKIFRGCFVGGVILLSMNVLALDLSSKGPIDNNLDDELSPIEKEELLSGKLIVKAIDVPEKMLPEFRLYKVLKVSPEEGMAVFSDFEHQKDYTPNLRLSHVIKVETTNSLFVSYRLETPWPLSDALYTTRNVLKCDGKGNYELWWNQIRSNSTKSTNGSARFLQFKGNTVFAYKSLVEPENFLARFFGSRFKNDVTDTYLAISEEIERKKARKESLLSQEILLLRSILAGKNAYPLEK